MALFKPEVVKNTSGFLGVQEMGIIEFTDKSADYDWADVFIQIEVAIPNSQYTNTIDIKGSLEKNVVGEITGGSVLKRLYNIFETIGCTAGINLQGDWEDESGNEITNIAEYLNKRFAEGTPSETQVIPFNYVGYMYKVQNKKTKKVYTDIYPKLCSNSDKGKQELDSYINWMDKKGYLKEYKETDKSSTPSVTQAALDNL